MIVFNMISQKSEAYQSLIANKTERVMSERMGDETRILHQKGFRYQVTFLPWTQGRQWGKRGVRGLHLKKFRSIYKEVFWHLGVLDQQFFLHTHFPYPQANNPFVQSTNIDNPMLLLRRKTLKNCY